MMPRDSHHCHHQPNTNNNNHRDSSSSSVASATTSTTPRVITIIIRSMVFLLCMTQWKPPPSPSSFALLPVLVRNTPMHHHHRWLVMAWSPPTLRYHHHHHHHHYRRVGMMGRISSISVTSTTTTFTTATTTTTTTTGTSSTRRFLTSTPATGSFATPTNNNSNNNTATATTTLPTTDHTTPNSTTGNDDSVHHHHDDNSIHKNRMGIEYIQNCVVQVLQELYHPEQIARGKIMAKLLAQQQQPPTKVSKKKNKNQKTLPPTATNTTEDNTAPESSPEPPLTVSQILDRVETEYQQQQQQQQFHEGMPPPGFTKTDAAVTAATRPEFGDYQCNAALTLAPALAAHAQLVQLQQQQQQELQLYDSTNSTVPITSTSTTITTNITPRVVAEQMVTALIRQLPNMTMEIAGPGFINLQFSRAWLSHTLREIVSDPRLGIPPLGSSSSSRRQQQRIVVDFSSPNIAKEMHVGHLRSTIIGDTLCNVLEFIGHDVIRLNHIGDWGTQFGMLVEHLRDECPAALDPDQAETIDLGDLVVLYKAAKQRFDADDAFKQRARDGVVKLQAGDEESLAAWKSLCSTSRMEYQKIYDMLNIKGLNERGESFYNPYLADVIRDLQGQGLAVESDGALAVFLDGYRNRDGTPLPMLVRKSDGGYNYATTDLAAIRHRTSLDNGEKADRVLYVTDAGQSQHFDMVFEAAKKAKFVPEISSLEHVPFGLVQGEDGKKFATRSGETVKLKDLLDEAVRIAGKDMRERRDTPPSDEYLDRVDRVARIVGIGAVKYADLSMNRESNYRFSYERMLSLNGNTAPYMLYAYARICSIVRKASGQADDGSEIVWPPVASEILITHESESDLIRNLVKLSDVIYEVERDLYPNRICDYLFETSQKFSKFYENCSVNQAETAALKASRLSICTATARTIRLLLTLLGIEVVDKL